MDYKYIYGIISAICFGSLTTIAKLGMISSSPETLLILRFLLVVTIIFLFSSIFKISIKIKESKLKLLLLCIFFSLETIFFWFALSDMDIIPFLALFWTYPLIIYIINIYLTRQFSYKSLLLIITGIVGVFLATGVVNI